MNRYSLLVALAATSFIAPAAQAEVFNGPYVGGVVGYDASSISATIEGESGKVTGDGVTGGLTIGYDLKLGNEFLLGGELQGLVGGAKLNLDGASLKTDYTLSAGVRAGVVVSDFLVFAKVAYVRSRFKGSDGIDSAREDGDGFGFGGGFQYPVSKQISLRLDYLHVNYTVADDFETAVGADVDIKRDQVLAGVAFHF